MNTSSEMPGEINDPDENLLYKNNRELFYSFDPEHHYSRRVDYQYQGNQLIIKQSWDVAQERVDQVKEKIRHGEVSPLAYFMEKNLMEIPMLSDYSGFPKRKVKKHLTPSGFSKLDRAALEKYAYAFNVKVEELLNPDLESGIEITNRREEND
jgi:hypothetical protein